MDWKNYNHSAVAMESRLQLRTLTLKELIKIFPNLYLVKYGIISEVEGIRIEGKLAEAEEVYGDIRHHFGKKYCDEKSLFDRARKMEEDWSKYQDEVIKNDLPNI